MRTYILVRRLPTSEIKAHTTPFATVQDAADAAGWALFDNVRATKAGAREFAAALAAQPIGTIWGHPSGYDFRILIAYFTKDGTPITPGMRVFNYYDRVWGVVAPEQFMRQSPLAPGGRHFEGWYDVARDADAHPMVLNGERLTTKEN